MFPKDKKGGKAVGGGGGGGNLGDFFLLTSAQSSETNLCKNLPVPYIFITHQIIVVLFIFLLLRPQRGGQQIK